MDDGSTKEEWKMAVETRKILDPDIEVIATCVRVPVFIGHAEAVHRRVRAAGHGGRGARAVLRDAPGVVVVDQREDGGYITPLECQGEDATYVSRIRIDPTVEHGLAFWCVSDNLRKGAALNAVQIAETLVAQGLLARRARVAREARRGLAWAWLAAAGLFEVVWVVLLKQTDGFTRPIAVGCHRGGAGRQLLLHVAVAAQRCRWARSMRSGPASARPAGWPGASPWKASRRALRILCVG